MDNTPEKPVDTSNGNSNHLRRSNIDLIYSYTESVLEAKISRIRTLDARLATFMAFAGGLLKLFVDIPTKGFLIHGLLYYAFQLINIGGGLLAVASIILIATALTARASADVTSPTVLTQKKWYWAEDESVKKVIVKQWLKAIDSVDFLAKRKSRFLNAAIKIIALAGVLYGVSFIFMMLASNRYIG